MNRVTRATTTLVVIALMIVGMASSAFAHPEPSNLEPKYGGTLVFSNRVEPKTLNPNTNLDFESFFSAHAGIFDRLVAVNSETGAILPQLAESWDVSDDATVFTFNIHPDAKWHDGEPVTSNDVKWTFDAIVKDQTWQISLLDQVKGVTTPDEHTAVVTLKNPNAAFLSRLGELNGPVILPAHIYEGTDWINNPQNDEPIGSGPFKFVEWQKGSHIKMEANLDYHWGRPYVDYLILRFIPSQAVDTAALENGQIQYMSQSPPFGELERLKENPDLKVQLVSQMVPIWVGFNLRREPFNDLKVRQAIAMAVDKEDIAERVYYGYCPVAEGSYLSTSWAFNPNATEPEYNPEEAERLLDEAGYPRGDDGIRFSTTVIDSITMGFAETNQVLKQQLAEIGINVTIESLEWGSFSEKVLNKYDFDIALVGGPHGPDPDAFSNFVETGRLRNSMGYSNERVDELFTLARSAGDQSERKQYYDEIQQIVAEELPRFNIVEYNWPYAYRADWHGFAADPDYEGQVPDYDMSHVWWDDATGSELASETTGDAATTGTTSTWLYVIGAIVVIAIVYFLMRRNRQR